MNKNILVLGGNGYIGNALIPKLKNAGYNVYYDDSKKLNILVDQFTLEEYLKEIKPEVIINLAGKIPYEDRDSLDNEIFAVNTVGVLNLATVCKKVGIKHFIQASSIAIYGFEKRESQYVQNDEYEIVEPTNLYGISKLCSEKILELFSDDFMITVFRIANVYGGIGRKGVIEKFIEQIKNNETIIIDRDYHLTNYIHVKDVVDAIVVSINRNAGLNYEIYNLGEDEYTLEEMIKKIGEVLKIDPIVKYDISKEDHVLTLDCLKIKDDLDFLAMPLKLRLQMMINEM